MAAALNVKAVAFDVFGTLYDVNSVLSAVRQVVPNAETLVSRWRAKQLEYSFLISMMGRFEGFWGITGRALEFTLKALNLTLAPEEKGKLMEAWKRLEPYPEARQALSSLKAKLPLAVLSNGNVDFLEALLGNTGLREFFSHLISAEEAGRYKPDPAVYNLASRRLGFPLGDILMVSSNSFDVIGAKAAGMRVCWVRRAPTPLDEFGIQPDWEVRDLQGVAASL